MGGAAIDGVIIEVRVNEYAMRDANRHVPWSPDEIAADAATCVEAGAAIVHYHARDPRTGAPATDAAIYAETVRAIRARCDALIMPTLGANTLPDPADRVAHVVTMARDPSTKPELAPVDLGSFNLDPYDPVAKQFRVDDLVYVNSVRSVRYLIDTIRGAGVAPMAALWSVGSARLLEALLDGGVLLPPVYAQVTLSDTLLATHPGTVAGLQALVEFLPGGIVWSVLCVGGNVLKLVAPAVDAGGHLAVGLGDYPYRELGEPTNADVVRAVVRELHALGRRPATPEEARAALAL